VHSFIEPNLFDNNATVNNNNPIYSDQFALEIRVRIRVRLRDALF